jgi:UDP-glucose:glycoprotein glucosyltransferase
MELFSTKFFPRLWLGLMLAVCVLGQNGNSNKKSKIFTTVLNTKWSNTPLVLEAAEYLAEENSEYFWDFLDYLADKQSIDLKRLTAQETYENVISFASR